MDLGSDEGGASAGVKIFDYDTIVKSLSVADAIETVEDAFCKLAQDKVDVPMPMHITIDETATAGPGDCHVKGGYVSSSACPSLRWTRPRRCAPSPTSSTRKRQSYSVRNPDLLIVPAPTQTLI